MAPRPAEPGAFVFRDLDADTTTVVYKGGGERAADAADEAHRSWARKEPFWDTHAAERRWAERARKEGVEEASSSSEAVEGHLWAHARLDTFLSEGFPAILLRPALAETQTVIISRRAQRGAEPSRAQATLPPQVPAFAVARLPGEAHAPRAGSGPPAGDASRQSVTRIATRTARLTIHRSTDAAAVVLASCPRQDQGRPPPDRRRGGLRAPVLENQGARLRPDAAVELGRLRAIPLPHAPARRPTGSCCHVHTYDPAPPTSTAAPHLWRLVVIFSSFASGFFHQWDPPPRRRKPASFARPPAGGGSAAGQLLRLASPAASSVNIFTADGRSSTSPPSSLASSSGSSSVAAAAPSRAASAPAGSPRIRVFRS